MVQKVEICTRVSDEGVMYITKFNVAETITKF